MTDPESPESLAWAELQQRGSIRARYLRDLDEEVAAELARCFDPLVHEQEVRPYGAIVTRETPHLGRLGRIINTEGLEPDLVRSLADGKHSVMLIVKDLPPQLLLLRATSGTPAAAACAARRAPRTHC